MAEPDVPRAPRQQVRERLVDVAAQLLAEHGATAVTTRSVARAAGVQAPTIYRLFGDKDGLLEAVAEHVMTTYVTAKSEAVSSAGAADLDPVADLRAGWDTHVAFGLANPALFGLLHEPARAATSPASAAGLDVLRARVHRVAAAGRLRVGERRAVDLLHAAGTGAVLTLLALAPDQRDLDLAGALWSAVSRAVLVQPSVAVAGDGVTEDGVTADGVTEDGVTGDGVTGDGVTEDGVTATAVLFRTVLPGLPALSDAERALLAEWLDRAIAAGQDGPAEELGPASAR